MGKKQQVIVKRYKNEKEFQKDANKMAKKGYYPDGVNIDHNRGSMVTKGFFTPLNVFKGKHEPVVTYRLAEK
jgi:hypothetical protein